jgi:hypothetical protein
VDCCEIGNENLSSIKCGIFLDCMGSDWLLKADSAARSKVISYYPIVFVERLRKVTETEVKVTCVRGGI